MSQQSPRTTMRGSTFLRDAAPPGGEVFKDIDRKE